MSSFDSTDIVMTDRAMGEQNRRLKAYLEECKLQLSELLQKDSKVSDVSIKNGYLNLYDFIETWIGSVSYTEKEGCFNKRFNEILQEESRHPQGRLADLDLFPDSDEYYTNLRDLQDLLGNQDSTNCVVLSVLIWKYLDETVLKEKFPVGTLKDEEFKIPRSNGSSNTRSAQGHALLGDIIEVMEEKYQNQGGSRRVNKWRSETLTAMVETPVFKDRQKKCLDALTKDLLIKLDLWISRTTLSGSTDELIGDIVVPAVKLHQDMKCSSTEYDLHHAKLKRGKTPKQPGSWVAKDIKTLTQINSTDIDWVASYHQYPGLYRLDESKSLELIKLAIIVCKRRVFLQAMT